MPSLSYDIQKKPFQSVLGINLTQTRLYHHTLLFFMTYLFRKWCVPILNWAIMEKLASWCKHGLQWHHMYSQWCQIWQHLPAHLLVAIGALVSYHFSFKTRFRRGSNPRPLACEASVITTTLRNHFCLPLCTFTTATLYWLLAEACKHMQHVLFLGLLCAFLMVHLCTSWDSKTHPDCTVTAWKLPILTATRLELAIFWSEVRRLIH